VVAVSFDDYRDWLFRTKLAPEEPAPPQEMKPAPPPAVDPRAQRRREAEERQARSAARKPLESRSKRLEEQMAKLAANKAAIDARLADPAIYGEDQKETLKTLILDQAYAARELAQVEAEWLELQRRLEDLAA
jgi:ATP-binding cassette subfamily F protein 3